MATSFQVKVHGKWRDMEFPWVSLEALTLAVRRDGGERDGSKLNETSMKMLLDLAKEKWGDEFKATMAYVDPGFGGLARALSWDCIMVLAARPDLLKLGVCWETARQLPSTLKGDGTLKENWDEEDGFIEITILPGN